jgi:hypothetical protein
MCACVCVWAGALAPAFKYSNKLIDFQVTWRENNVLKDTEHLNFNSLQSVITTWQSRELLRRQEHYCPLRLDREMICIEKARKICIFCVYNIFLMCNRKVTARTFL